MSPFQPPEVFKDPSDADYRLLVAAVAKGKATVSVVPRYATEGFRPNRQYVREMKRYGILPPSFDPAKDAIDFFQTDQAYWRSAWIRPDARP